MTKKIKLNVLDLKQLKSLGYNPKVYHGGPAIFQKQFTKVVEVLVELGFLNIFNRAYFIHDFDFAHNTGLFSRFLANLRMRSNMFILLEKESKNNSKVKLQRKILIKRIKGAFWLCMIGMFFYKKKVDK